MQTNVDLRATYFTALNTVTARYKPDLPLPELRNLYKWAILCSRHVLIHDAMLIDHQPTRSLFQESDFRPLLTEGDLDGLPIVIVGLRPSASVLLDVLDDMRRHYWYSSSNIRVNDVWRDRKEVPKQEFLDAFPGPVLKQIRRISSFLESTKSTANFDLNRHRFKNLVVEACSEEQRPRSDNPRFNRLLDKFLSLVQDIEPTEASRSIMIRNANIAGVHSRIPDLVPALNEMILDTAWNLNSTVSNNLTPIINATSNTASFRKLYRSFRRTNQAASTLPFFVARTAKIRKINIDLDALSFGQIVKLRKNYQEQFDRTTGRLYGARLNFSKRSEAIKDHHELIVRALVDMDILKVDLPKPLLQLLSSPLVKLITERNELASAVWQALVQICRLPEGVSGFTPITDPSAYVGPVIAASSVIGFYHSKRLQKRKLVTSLGTVFSAK